MLREHFCTALYSRELWATAILGLEVGVKSVLCKAPALKLCMVLLQLQFEELSFICVQISYAAGKLLTVLTHNWGSGKLRWGTESDTWLSLVAMYWPRMPSLAHFSFPQGTDDTLFFYSIHISFCIQCFK